MALSRRAIIIPAILVLLFLVFLAASKNYHRGFTSVEITLGGKKIRIELARTPTEQERGLSGRANLPADRGMLFVYQDDVKPTFWMKGMRFPIDIIWLDKNLTIVGFEKDVIPSTFPETFSPPETIRYVLEVNAGFVDKHQLKIGDRAYN